MMFPRMFINQMSESLTCFWNLSCLSTAIEQPTLMFSLISQFDVNKHHLMTNVTIFYHFTVTPTGSTSASNLSLSVQTVFSCLVLFCLVVTEKFRFVYSLLFL